MIWGCTVFLHEDKEVFREIIIAPSDYTGRTVDIVEKDYRATGM